jgi:hypothetical protein
MDQVTKERAPGAGWRRLRGRRMSLGWVRAMDVARRRSREISVAEGKMRDGLLIRECPSVPCILPCL